MTIRVLILKDQRAGHYNQSEGIVAALKKRMEVEVSHLEIERQGAVAKRFVRWASNLPNFPSDWLLGLAGLNLAKRKQIANASFDLIVSAGGQTLPANILLSRKFSALNIFSGSLRGIGSQHFSAVLHIDPLLASDPRFIIGLKPSLVEPLAKRADFMRTERFVLLLGGPTRRQAIDIQDFTACVRMLQASELDWDIINSRRTPDRWTELFREAALAKSNITLHETESTTSQQAAEIIQNSNAIVATADSVSMISEGVEAGLPVVSVGFPVETIDSDGRYLQYLEDNKWYAPLELAGLDEEKLLAAFDRCSPLEENHLDILGDQLIEKVPELQKFA